MVDHKESNAELVCTFEKLLSDDKFDEINHLLCDNAFTRELQATKYNILSNLIQFLVTHQAEQTAHTQKYLEMFDTITKKSDPEDLLLSLLQEFESVKSRNKFLILLIPLEKILLQLPKKRIHPFAWGLNAIQVYLNEIDLPKEENIEIEDEYSSLNEKIISIYESLIPFYHRLIENVRSQGFEYHRIILAKFMLKLFGKPFIKLAPLYLTDTNNRVENVAYELVKEIFTISSDIYHFLEMFTNNLTDTGTIDEIALTNLFYLVRVKHICNDLVPKVYNFGYIFQMSLPILSECLKEEDKFLTSIALCVSRVLLNDLVNTKLTSDHLDSIYHKRFCQQLVSIIVYNSEEHVRKEGLQIYQSYLFSFDNCGRFLLVNNLMNILTHSGLIGYTITLYKNMIAEQLDSSVGISEYIMGSKLFRILNRFCFLHAGGGSDLSELSDQIIATLNLLRYLAIRDKNNVTGVWDFFETLPHKYLTPLNEGLISSEEHYNLKLKEVQAGAQTSDTSISVLVAGHSLNDLTTKEKIDILNSTLTSFHVIKSLLCRVTELIKLGRNPLH